MTKTVFITGGSTGIGAAAVAKFVRDRKYHLQTTEKFSNK